MVANRPTEISHQLLALELHRVPLRPECEKAASYHV